MLLSDRGQKKAFADGLQMQSLIRRALSSSSEREKIEILQRLVFYIYVPFGLWTPRFGIHTSIGCNLTAEDDHYTEWVFRARFSMQEVYLMMQWFSSRHAIPHTRNDLWIAIRKSTIGTLPRDNIEMIIDACDINHRLDQKYLVSIIGEGEEVSVAIKFRWTVPRLMPVGRERLLRQVYIDSMFDLLEIEKTPCYCYFPLMLQKKKRYVGASVAGTEKSERRDSLR